MYCTVSKKQLVETLAKLFPPVDITDWLKAKNPVVFPIIGNKVGQILVLFAIVSFFDVIGWF